MEHDELKKILTRLSIAGLFAGITVAASPGVGLCA